MNSVKIGRLAITTIVFTLFLVHHISVDSPDLLSPSRSKKCDGAFFSQAFGAGYNKDLIGRMHWVPDTQFYASNVCEWAQESCNVSHVPTVTHVCSQLTTKGSCDQNNQKVESWPKIFSRSLSVEVLIFISSNSLALIHRERVLLCCVTIYTFFQFVVVIHMAMEYFAWRHVLTLFLSGYLWIVLIITVYFFERVVHSEEQKMIGA
jgi:hypothetical protein